MSEICNMFTLSIENESNSPEVSYLCLLRAVKMIKIPKKTQLLL